MARPENEGFRHHKELPHLEQPHPADLLVASVVEYASISDESELKRKFWDILPRHIDRVHAGRAVSFADQSHEEQERKLRIPPVPFIVHPLAVTHLFLEHVGDKITLEQFQIMVLHDTVEDGEIDGRPVTTRLIEAKFGERVAFGVNAMTNDDGDAVRYYRELEQADRDRPELRLIDGKVIDRMFNLLDPASGMLLPSTQTKRQEKIADTKNRFIPTLLAGPRHKHWEKPLGRVLQLSEESVQKGTVPTEWAAKVRTREA